jgi:hypothetical protein
MRSRVSCSFQFLPGIASAAFLRSESRGTHEHMLLPLFYRLPQPGVPVSCIYFPQEQGSPVIPQGMKLELIHDRQSVGQSVLVSGAHLRPVTNFSFAMKFSVDSCGFVILQRPL